MNLRARTVAGLIALASTAMAVAAPGLNVGSKRFTESYILGEILKQTAQAAGEAPATHSQGLGNTAIVLNALTTGSIDVYPEYTGTIAKEILKLDSVPPLAELDAKLAPMGLAVAVPLGFNNTYALAMRGDDARAKNIARLSDLAAHPEVRLGLSQARDTMLPQVIIERRFRPFVEDHARAFWSAPNRCLVAHPEAERDLRAVLPTPTTDPMVVAIGPEGGWVPFEVALLEAHGFERVTAGPRLLRVDTAVPFLIGQLALMSRV